MKIVMLGPFAFSPKGTVSARALPLALALVKRGHGVTILMPPYDHPEDSGCAWNKDGVQLENLVVARNDLRHQAVVPLRLAVRAIRLKPDVVHVFKPIGYSGLAGQFLRTFTRLPLVVDTDDWEGRGGWADANAYPGSWKRLFAWQEQWLLGRASAVTVASRTLQTQAWGFGVEPCRVTYLPNGPEPQLGRLRDLTAAERAEVRRALGLGDCMFALYLGHIPRTTDLDLAIEALALLRDRLPEARLVIAGSGAGLPALVKRAEAAGVQDRVLFPGWIDRDRAPAIVAAADVVVNPYRDTLINRAKCAGKVVMAMALGRAVVTSRIGENLEYIRDGYSGLLTEPGNAHDLADAVARLLLDRELAEELGRRARDTLWKRFDWDLLAPDAERVYRQAARLGTAPV